jgi:hypothetical protein
MARFALWQGRGRILCREAAPVQPVATEGYGSANAVFAYEEAGCLPCARHTEKPDRLNSTSAQLTRSVVTQPSDPDAGVDRVDRAVTSITFGGLAGPQQGRSSNRSRCFQGVPGYDLPGEWQFRPFQAPSVKESDWLGHVIPVSFSLQADS